MLRGDTRPLARPPSKNTGKHAAAQTRARGGNQETLLHCFHTLPTLCGVETDVYLMSKDKLLISIQAHGKTLPREGKSASLFRGLTRGKHTRDSVAEAEISVVARIFVLARCAYFFWARPALTSTRNE